MPACVHSACVPFLLTQTVPPSRRLAVLFPVVAALMFFLDTRITGQFDAEFLSDGRVLVKTNLVGRYTIEVSCDVAVRIFVRVSCRTYHVHMYEMFRL